MSMSTTPTRITQETFRCHKLNIRAGYYNAGVVYILRNAEDHTGYLYSGDSIEMFHTRPTDIWVYGTAGDNIFWNGDQT